MWRLVVHSGDVLTGAVSGVIHRSSPFWGQRHLEMWVGLVGRDLAPRERQSRDWDLMRAVRSATWL